MSTTFSQQHLTLKGHHVTVIGGSGFVGRYVVRRLAKAGASVRVACRDVEAAQFLRMAGEVGQVVPVVADITRPESITAAVKGADIVVNLVGILYASGSNTFQAVQAAGAAQAAAAAKAAGAKTFIQMSAIGANAQSAAAYAKTKAQGEAGVIMAFPEATILRPSIIFGEEDGFFNQFGAMATLTPILPLIGGGKTKFQPVSVRDVAEAVYQAIIRPEAAAKTYELGGPQIYTFKELLEFILTVTNRHALLLPVPWSLAKLKAFFLGLLPKPLLTRDQVEMLKSDNIVGKEALTMADLGIDAPEAVDVITPGYLDRYRKGGYFKQPSA